MLYQGKTLFTFVEYKDPFAPGEVAGEEQPGPVLSLLEARRFDHAFLFHTPHLEAVASATAEEVQRRYPGCTVHLQPLAVSDPKDYSSLMGALAQAVRRSVNRSAPAAEHFVCVSSGTAEMRAAWFLLSAAGVLRATLLQLGSPAEPLYGGANVREVRLESGAWKALRDLVMPIEYFTSPGSFEDLFSTEIPFKSRRSRSAASAQPQASLPAPAPPPKFEALDQALLELGIFIGSATMRHAAEKAAIAADSPLPVLLHGETGTGKELFARLLHRLSDRARRPLVAVNCAAIPKDLVESQLFGHRRGSFTGAAADYKGKFEQADGGTLFLDEVGELAADAQAKLLRVLQEGRVEPVGGSGEVAVDVRIVAATNRDLAGEVDAGTFRKDLFYRLEVVRIDLPPLRERRAEVPLLAASFLRRINHRRKHPRQLTTAALQRLERHSWPGNVRELSNVLERSVLYAPSDHVDDHDLLIELPATGGPTLLPLPELADGFKMDEYLGRIREGLVRKALAMSGGSQSGAAALLGITKQSLHRYLKTTTSAQTDSESAAADAVLPRRTPSG